MDSRTLSLSRLWLLKAVIFILSCAFILWHLNSQIHRLDDAHIKWQTLAGQLFTPLSVLIVMLSLLNWSIEAFKWQKLLQGTAAISFGLALRAFFNGITISFFTPNRVGEFAGRIVFLPPGKRFEGALLAFLGSSSQLLVTIQAGLLSLAVLLDEFWSGADITLLLCRIALCAIVVLSSIGWVNLPKVVLWTDKLKIQGSWKSKVHVWDKFSFSELRRIWCYSLLRYSVFTLQPLLLFQLTGVEMSLKLCLLVPVTYLFITAIPSIALGELGVRGSVNLAVFGLAGMDTTAILIVTFLIWFINLAIPASFGAFSILFIRFRKAKNNKTA